MAPAEAAAHDPGPARKFCTRDFRQAPEKDALICPAGEELRLIGVYREAYGAPYRVYGRSHCAPCVLNTQCTEGRGRRVKLPVTTAATGEPNATPSTGPPVSSPTGPGEVTQLVEALAARMREMGDRIRTFRSTTIEPVNAHLKQHGLRRFHVHGLARCSTVLTLACTAHNLMKWKAREAARALRALA